MKASRIAILLVAAAAAGGAFLLASGSKPPEPVAALPAPAPAPLNDSILTAAKDLPVGTVLNEADLSWQPWPKAGLTSGMIVQAAEPRALDDVKGSIAREPFYGGEPIHREKLVKNGSGFMSVILPAGYRAVAINIDASGSTTAGGFILPNDHVDVVKTFTDTTAHLPPGTQPPTVSETILQNVRVLAIGPNVQNKDGQPVVVGSTATLALDPGQAETVILAQRTGQLSLTLRSILDLNSAATASVSQGLTVVRFGTATEGGTR